MHMVRVIKVNEMCGGQVTIVCVVYSDQLIISYYYRLLRNNLVNNP